MFRSRRTAVALSLTLATAASALLVGAPSASAVVDTVSYGTYVSERDEYIGLGRGHTYLAPDDTVLAQFWEVTDRQTLRVFLSNGKQNNTDIVLTAPMTQEIGVGTYRDGSIDNSSTQSTEITVDVRDRGCLGRGTFTIHDLEIVDDAVTRLSASYTYQCRYESSPRIFGEIGVNEPALSTEIAGAPQRVTWPLGDRSKDHRFVSVLVTAGASDVELDATIVSDSAPPGATSSGFEMIEDGCTGTLRQNSSCKILVDFNLDPPDPYGLYEATLQLGGSTSGEIPLNGETTDGRSGWRDRLVSSTGDVRQPRTLGRQVSADFDITGDAQEVSLDLHGELDQRITFAAPSGTSLQEGKTYVGAQATPGQDADRAGFSMSAPSCRPSYASFRVHEIATDPVNGDVNHFAATYQFNCGRTLASESRIGVVAYRRLDREPAIPDYGQLDGLARSRTSLRVANAHPDYQDAVRLSGTVRSASGPAASESKVVLYGREAGRDSWERLGSTQTTRGGDFRFSRAAHVSTKHRVEFQGNTKMLASTSDIVDTTVHRDVVSKLADSRVRVGETTKVVGYVLPRDTVRVQLQVRRAGGRWLVVDETKTVNYGRFRWYISTSKAGQYDLRVVAEAKGSFAVGVSRLMPMRVG